MLRLALDIRPRIDYIVPISFTEGPFARVLSKVERARIPEMQRYTAYAGGSGIDRPALLPVCQVLAALVPERVLPFGSGNSRKRGPEPVEG